MEQGESICQAAVRETLEETGIILDHAALRHVLSIHQRNPGRPAGTSRRRDPSVAVRGKPTVTPTVPTARTPSAIRPWFPGYNGTRRYKAARPGTGTEQPA